MDDEEGNKTWNALDPPPAIDTIGARDRGRHTSRQQQQQPVFVVNIRLKRRGQQKPFNHLLQQQQVINGIASRRAKKKELCVVLLPFLIFPAISSNIIDPPLILLFLYPARIYGG